jgi:DnaK suppressor protein
MKTRSAPLSHPERELLRKQLENKLDELRRAAARDASSGVRTDDDYPNRMDAATRATEEHELLARADHEQRLAGEVAHALDKLAKGTYGHSELSGRPIPVARLRAVPWARLTEEEEQSRPGSRR